MDNLIAPLIDRPLNSFPTYIESIRFPYYKNLAPETKITFDFPLTVFVGPNGCGKTSALQALYGCPHRMSTSDFWFSTKVDPINDQHKKSANRYIYQYTPKGINFPVEVIKTHRRREGNPDYWETARPNMGDKMAAMPENSNNKEKQYRSASRWNAVTKQVTYIDFKAELSSYDKFIYFGEFSKGKTINTKQDFIRRRADPLKIVFDTHHKSYTYHSKKVFRNELLTKEELSWVSRILGKNYDEARLVEHNFFGNQGLSILFKEKSINYSEAVAGSGEVAVVSCVQRVLSSDKGSLILLDEPEVSLHPKAQQELRNLLLDQITKKHLQVILTTHSPAFVEGLPKGAIKVFHTGTTDKGYEVINDAIAEQAFVHIGSSQINNIIYVEDRLSALFVDKALREMGDDLKELFDIKVYPGGGEQIKQDLLINFSLTPSPNSFVLLDGDQKLHDNDLHSGNIKAEDYKNLANIVKKHVGINIKLPLDGGNGDSSKQKAQCFLKVLDTYSERFFFVNSQTPEDLLWSASIGSNLLVSDINQKGLGVKENFVEYAKTDYGQSSVNSDDIFYAQKSLLGKVPNSAPLWSGFYAVIKNIVSSMSGENIS